MSLTLPWRLTLLGGCHLEAADGSARISRFRSQKTAALLACLATQRSHPHAREELIARFWPDSDSAAGRQSLRVALTTLRQQLEPEGIVAPGSVLSADRQFVSLVFAAVTTDTFDFEEALREAGREMKDAARRTDFLGQAVQFYGGPLLPGFYDDGVLRERERLHGLFIDALRELADVYESTGETRLAFDCVERLIGSGEDEDERAGRLRAQLNAAAPKPVSPTAFPLPRPLDTFVGRETETARVVALLRDSPARLITLIGPGGTGKTRLALEAAARLNAQTPPCWVPLASVTEAARLPEVLRDALGLPRLRDGNALAQVTEKLALAPLLILLDNFEQVEVGGGAQFVRTLLRAAPHTRLLVTSRRRLGVAGEKLFPVPPLAVPPPPGEQNVSASVSEAERDTLDTVASVRLFVLRSQAAAGDFALTTANAASVAALCARLEGLPLAIELAAVWSAVLTPSQMLRRLSGQFTLLASRERDKAERHRSLWATIAWSYDLLPPSLQQVWARLSVFRGGCTPAAAAAICEVSETEIHEMLARLCERSLVVGEDRADEMRFSLLESLRAFAWEKLDKTERDTSCKRHADYYCQFGRDARTGLRGAEQNDWIRRLEADHDNVRSALDYFMDAPDGAGNILRLTYALSAFWRGRGYLHEGRERSDTALNHVGGHDLQVSEARAAVLNSVGMIAWMQGDLGAAQAYYEEAMTLWRADGNAKGVSVVLDNLSLLAMEAEDYDLARTLSTESLAMHRENGDQASEAGCLGTLGNAALDQSRWQEGRAYHQASLALHRALGDHSGTAISLSSLAFGAQKQGDFETARALYREAIEIRQAAGDDWRIAHSLLSVGDLMQAMKRPLDGITLYAASETRQAALGMVLSPARRASFNDALCAMQKSVAAADFEQAYATGRAFDGPAAVAFALGVLRV